MKNLLIHIGQFNKEHEVLARIQIDNSLDLGWHKAEILLLTDFPYKYNGIEAIVLPHWAYEFDKTANKSKVLARLDFDDELYWCHDFDAYENEKIIESELGLENYDAGFTHYTYKPEWQFGSLFFKPEAGDIFKLLDKSIEERPYKTRNNEKKLTWLIKHNLIDPNRYKRMNPTYNFTKRYMKQMFKVADKPLKVLHFLPSNKDVLMPDTALNMFRPYMSDRLVKIFNHHGL